MTAMATRASRAGLMADGHAKRKAGKAGRRWRGVNRFILR
jgi:hypothetical protein